MHFSYFSDTNNSKKLTPAGVRAVRGSTVLGEKYGLRAGAVAPLALASYCCFHLLALSQWSSREPGGLQYYQTGAARGGGNKAHYIYTRCVLAHTQACVCVFLCGCVGMGLGPRVRNVLLRKCLSVFQCLLCFRCALGGRGRESGWFVHNTTGAQRLQSSQDDSLSACLSPLTGCFTQQHFCS